jgi:hypothetical protein
MKARQPVEKFVASKNLEHFRELLQTEKDDAKRRILLDLIALEIKKLEEESAAKAGRSPS